MDTRFGSTVLPNEITIGLRRVPLGEVLRRTLTSSEMAALNRSAAAVKEVVEILGL